MAISAEQREARRKMIGSSDAAAVLGLDPYRSASDVWLEKLGRVDDFAGNEATERGAMLEAVLIDYAARELGLSLQADVMLTHSSGLLCANLDASSLDTMALVEAKTSVNADEWGSPGSDEVPERVIVQVHHQFAVAGPKWRVAWVPVLLPGYRSLDFRIYRVERNDELASAVERSGIDFMQTHVLPAVQPSDFKPSIEVLKRVRREPEKTVPVPDEVAENWIAIRAARLQAEKDEELAQAALLTAMGDGDAASHSGGIITYFSQTARRLDIDRVKREHPDVAAACVKESTCRVMRIKASKQAGGRKLLAATKG